MSYTVQSAIAGSAELLVISFIDYYYYYLLLLTRRLAWRLVQSPKTARTRNTQKGDMFGRQRKKQGQQRHQYEDANKYVFKCRLKVDSDDDDVTNDGI